MEDFPGARKTGRRAIHCTNVTEHQFEGHDVINVRLASVGLSSADFIGAGPPQRAEVQLHIDSESKLADAEDRIMVVPALILAGYDADGNRVTFSLQSVVADDWVSLAMHALSAVASVQSFELIAQMTTAILDEYRGSVTAFERIVLGGDDD